LSGKQRRSLRARGQTLSAAVRVGKAGVTEAVVEQIRQELLRRELVKVRMPPPAPTQQRKAEAEELAALAGAILAGLSGRSALLYRPNPDLPAEKRLALPG